MLSDLFSSVLEESPMLGTVNLFGLGASVFLAPPLMALLVLGCAMLGDHDPDPSETISAPTKPS
jgi:hypothetical protein